MKKLPLEVQISQAVKATKYGAMSIIDISHYLKISGAEVIKQVKKCPDLTIVGNAVVSKKEGGNVWAIGAVVSIAFCLIQLFPAMVG